MSKRIIYIVIALHLALTSQAQVTFTANNTNGCSPLGVVLSVNSPSSGTISSYLWQITLPDGNIQSTTNAQYIAILTQAGTYDVSVTINGNQTATQTDYLTVFANPVAQMTVSQSTGCFPLCTNFSDASSVGSGNITLWNWDFGSGSTSMSQNPSYCYPSVGTFTPVLSIQDENGCFSSIVMPGLINVTDNFPTAAFTPSSSLTCNPPQVITFTNNSTGNSALTSEWSFGDGNTASTSGMASTSHSYSSSADYNACLTVTDQLGCQNQECHTITLFDQAIAQYTLSSTTTCTGQAINFTNQSTPTPTTFQWDFEGDGTMDSNMPNPSHTFTSPGIYYPSLIISYDSGCSDTLINAYPINVNPGINPQFNLSQTSSCTVPFTTAFNNTTTASYSNVQWFVNGAPITLSNGAYTFSSMGTYDIALQLITPGGCVGTSVQNDLVAISEPTIDFTPPVNICTGIPIDITGLSVSSPVLTYSWDFNNDGIEDATGQYPNYNYSITGIFFVTLTVVTTDGCVITFISPESTTVMMDVSTDISSNFTYSCAGETIEFCVSNQPGTQYSWNFGDMTGWNTMESGETCIQHEYQDSGYFDISLTVFNAACSATQVFPDYLYITPPISKWVFAVDCNDLLSVQFGDESILADTLIWNFGDGSPELWNDPSPVHVFPSPGSYDVSLTAINDDIGCPDVSYGTIVLLPADPSISFTNTSICPPALVDISSSANNAYWFISFSNGDSVEAEWNEDYFLWQVAYTHGGSTENTSVSQGQNFWPQLSFEEEGCYDASVSVIDQNGCSGSQFIQDAVCVNSGVDFASFTSTVISNCQPLEINFSANASNLTSYQWAFSDGAVTTQASPTHTFLPPFYYNSPLTATLSATSSSGCTSSVTQTIPVALPVMPSFTVIGANACANQPVQFINNTNGPATSYSWSFGDLGSGASNTSNLEDPTHSFVGSGTFPVCLSADNGAGCVVTTCNNAAVNILSPTASFTYTSSINNCLYGVSFTNTSQGNITSITWDFGDGQTGSGNSIYHTYPIGVYDATLIVSNSYCSDTVVINDIFNYGNVIGPYTTVIDNANCTPFHVDFAAFNPSDTYFTYFWDFNDGSGDPSGSTSASHDYLQVGTYCPAIIMTDPNGCEVYVECTNPIEVAAFELSYAAPQPICIGDTLVFNVTNGDSYSWDNTTFVESTSDIGEYLIFPNADIDLTLTGFYSDCQTTSLIHIDVNPLPIVTLSVDNSVCFGEAPFTLDGGFPSGAGGEYFVGDISSSEFNPSMTPNDYNVEYEYTDSNGCVNSATQTVTLHALPVITFNSFLPLCENASPITLDQASPVGGDYTMGGNSIGFFDPSIGLGAYPINYFYTDAYGCSNNSTQTLTVFSAPQISLDYSSVCLNQTVSITNNSTVGSGSISSTYWDFGVAGTQTIFQPSGIDYSTPGEYPIHVEMTSSYGCVSMIDTTVNVWVLPSASFILDQGCQYSSLQFVSSSAITQGSIDEWIWVAEEQVLTVGSALDYAFQGWGQLPLSLEVISDQGCRDTIVQTVNVSPVPLLDLQTTNTCFGEVSQMQSNGSVPIGGIVSYQWNLGDGTTEPSNPFADNLYAAAGSYVISVTATTNLNCTSTDTAMTTIYPLPVIDFAIDQPNVCSGDVLSLFDLSSVDSPYIISGWQWLLDDEIISSDANPIVAYHNPGHYDLSFVVTSSVGCSSDTTVQQLVRIFPKPEAGFLLDSDEISIWTPLVHIADQSSDDVLVWNYSFGDGVEETFESGTHLYDTFGIYDITQIVTNTFGCQDTMIKKLRVSEDIMVFVPNAFTPDGNGHNELFKPIISGFKMTFYELTVFDRWGTVIFQSEDPETCWNGAFRNEGEISADGVYNWQLKIRGSESPVIQTKLGVVTLLK